MMDEKALASMIANGNKPFEGLYSGDEIDRAYTRAMGGEFCGGCSFCCWSLQVEDVPFVSISGTPMGGKDVKPAGKPSPFTQGQSCGIQTTKPKSCRQYACVYALIEAGLPMFYVVDNGVKPWPWRVHQPEVFRGVVVNDIGKGFVPAVPTFIPVEAAKKLIRATKCCTGAEGGGYFIQFLAASEKYRTTENGNLWHMELSRTPYGPEILQHFNPSALRLMDKDISKNKDALLSMIDELISRGLSPDDPEAQRLMSSVKLPSFANIPIANMKELMQAEADV